MGLNSFNTPNVFLKMVGVYLGDELQIPSLMFKGVGEEFAKANNNGYKPGDQVTMERPPRFVPKRGLSYVAQPIIKQKMPITVQRTAHIGFDWGAVERTLTISATADLAKQSAIDLASMVNAEAATFCADNAMHSVGTPGTPPTDEIPYLAARDLIIASGLPRNEKLRLVTNARMSSAFITGTKGLQNPTGIISRQWDTGEMQRSLGLSSVVFDELINTHTVGTFSGTILVKGANQTAEGGDNATMDLIIDGITASLKRGDKFILGSASSATVNGVRRTYPRGGEESIGRPDSGYQQIFTVVNDKTDTSGDMTVTVRPAITISGPYQNMVAAPVDNAILTMIGTTGVVGKQALLMHKMAFGFVSVPLYKPDTSRGALVTAMTDPDTGLSIQMVQQYEGRESEEINKLQILYDFAVLYPELAAVIQG